MDMAFLFTIGKFDFIDSETYFVALDEALRSCQKFRLLVFPGIIQTLSVWSQYHYGIIDNWSGALEYLAHT